MQNAQKKGKHCCPPGLCMSSKPGCFNRGGKIVQMKSVIQNQMILKMRCCGEECEIHRQGVTRFKMKCPTGLCLESKPTCTRNGGKVIQVKPRDEDSKDLTMRCCGVQKCKMPHTAKKGKHCCKAPGIKTPKIYHRKCPPQMKMIHISKCVNHPAEDR